MIRMIIEKMSKGGFVVYDGDALSQGGDLCAAIHAATDIADALAFIGDNLAPVEKPFSPDCSAIKGAPCHDKGQCVECQPHRLRDLMSSAALWEKQVDAMACKVCGSLHSDAYCARQTCPGSQRKLYEPAADGSVNWDRRAEKFLHT